MQKIQKTKKTNKFFKFDRDEEPLTFNEKIYFCAEMAEEAFREGRFRSGRELATAGFDMWAQRVAK